MRTNQNTSPSGYIVFWLFGRIPAIYIAFAIAMAWIGGRDLPIDAKASETTALLTTISILAIIETARLLAIFMVSADPFAARWTWMFNGHFALKMLMEHGVLYLLWATQIKHGAGANLWLYPSLIACMAVITTMQKTGFMYGLGGAERERTATSKGGKEESDQAGEKGKGRRVVPAIRFSDISGNDEIKSRLLEASKAVMHRPPGTPLRNGILLHGEPGNGKTVFAEALAGELNLPLLQLTYSDVASMWVGERTVNIKNTFAQAVRMQPCVLFIDEIDSFIPERSSLSPNANKEDTDVVNALLTLLVDARKAKILLVAATNYMDRLDTAAVREGRFDFKVEITSPDEAARIGLLKRGLAKSLPNFGVDEEVVLTAAKRWNGFSAKRILAVTEELPSYISSRNEKGQQVVRLELADFMAALRRIQGRKGVALEDAKSLEDLVLSRETKAAMEMIAGRLRDPMRVERLGGSMPTGVLFHGPAGTGKTTAAKALAKSVDSAFLTSTGADLARDVKALEKLYAQAKELRPTIIFIDEADDLLRSREYSSNTEATNKLLTLMDGVNDKVKDVLWVAATNHPDQIDPALLRGGRFTEKVVFELPGNAQAIKHIQMWLVSRKVQLEGSLYIEDIANSIGLQSLANVEAVLQYALNRAIANTNGDHIQLTSEDIRVGIETVIFN